MRIILCFVVSLIMWGCKLKTTEELIQTRLNEARWYGKKKDYAKASQLTDEVISDYPDYAPAYLLKASYLLRLPGKKKEALVTLDKAIQIYPEFVPAYNLRGQIKHGFEALADFDRAIELDSLYAEAYYSRGQKKFGLYNYYGALEDYDKAIALNNIISQKTKSSIYCDRALVKIELVDYSGALADINMAIHLDSLDPVNYRIRHYYYARTHQVDLAEKDYQKSLALGIDSMAYALGVDTVPKARY